MQEHSHAKAFSYKSILMLEHSPCILHACSIHALKSSITAFSMHSPCMLYSCIKSFDYSILHACSIHALNRSITAFSMHETFMYYVKFNQVVYFVARFTLNVNFYCHFLPFFMRDRCSILRFSNFYCRH
jgi:hypothetical protein